MEFFYHPLSRYSQKVLIALYEKQANFDAITVDLRDPFSRQKFYQLYPQARVPLLKTQDEQLIPESSIIIEYLDRHFYSSTQLLPTEPMHNLQVRLFDRIIDNDISNPLLQLEKIKDIDNSNEFEIKKIEKQLLLQFQHLDAQLTLHHWICGDSFTLADCALIPCLNYAFKNLNLLDFDQVVRYWQQAQLRGAWMLVQEEILLTEQEDNREKRGIP